MTVNRREGAFRSSKAATCQHDAPCRRERRPLASFARSSIAVAAPSSPRGSPSMLLGLLVIPTAAALLPGWRSPRAVVVAPMMTAAAPSGLSVLSVAELKRLLSERGVDSRDCLEKRDLIERLESVAGQGSSSSDGGGAPTSLTDDERRRIATFQRVSPSVAYIQTVQQPRALPFAMRAMEVPGGTGSGFVWDDLGHIVTNYHVVAMRGSVPERVRVSLQGSTKSFEAKVVGTEPEKDLAVLTRVGLRVRVRFRVSDIAVLQIDTVRPTLTLTLTLTLTRTRTLTRSRSLTRPPTRPPTLRRARCSRSTRPSCRRPSPWAPPPSWRWARPCSPSATRSGRGEVDGDGRGGHGAGGGGGRGFEIGGGSGRGCDRQGKKKRNKASESKATQSERSRGEAPSSAARRMPVCSPCTRRARLDRTRSPAARTREDARDELWA